MPARLASTARNAWATRRPIYTMNRSRSTYPPTCHISLVSIPSIRFFRYDQTFRRQSSCLWLLAVPRFINKHYYHCWSYIYPAIEKYRSTVNVWSSSYGAHAFTSTENVMRIVSSALSKSLGANEKHACCIYHIPGLNYIYCKMPAGGLLSNVCITKRNCQNTMLIFHKWRKEFFLSW